MDDLIKIGFEPDELRLLESASVFEFHPPLAPPKATGAVTPGDKRSRATRMPRTCLRCRRTFPSEGIHNRIYPSCRDWIDGPDAPVA